MTRFRRRRNMKPTAIGGLVLKAMPKKDRRFVDPRILVAWYRHVPKRIAHAACPTKFDRGTLYVAAKSAAWAQELTALQEELRRFLRQGGVVVQHFRFREGKVPDLAPPSSRAELPKPVRKLSDVDPDFARALAAVSDDDLRDLLRDIASIRKS